MNIQYHTQNFTLTQDLKSHVEYQLKKIEKLADPLGGAVYISRNTHHQKGDIFTVEINIHIPKKIISAKEKNASDVRAAIMLVTEKLKKQLLKFKGKRAAGIRENFPSRSIKGIFQGIRRLKKMPTPTNLDENNSD